ncbi:MAG TPA: 6-phosphogluconolactonase [Phycisphaerales bacterium]|nr:6-phosphogluconolactonase [Phycisphaerales bacterium]HMP37421.1 6-phosphogluconolactonase [Phycisphaerales bacterium]
MPKPARDIDGGDDFADLYERNKLHRVERNGSPEAYVVESDAFEPPALPGEVAAARDLDAIIDALAADLLVQATNCVRTFGDFHLALSGDAVLEPVYERLMYDPNVRSLPWQRTHLWMVAERCVAFDDVRSRFRMVRETIVDHSDIPPEQVHPIFPLGETPAASYEAHLREVLAWREKGQDRLDFALLALRPDAAVAEWAPGSRLLHDPALVAREARGAEGDGPVVTMTPTILNAARFVAVHVDAIACGAALRRLMDGHDPAEALPAKALHPAGGVLKWYVGAWNEPG